MSAIFRTLGGSLASGAKTAAPWAGVLRKPDPGNYPQPKHFKAKWQHRLAASDYPPPLNLVLSADFSGSPFQASPFGELLEHNLLLMHTTLMHTCKIHVHSERLCRLHSG
jgi:hypothetical protein